MNILVNGEAVLSVDLPTSMPSTDDPVDGIINLPAFGNWQDLGITVDGVSIRIDTKYKEVETDEEPVGEVIFQGAEAEIEAEVILFDGSVLNHLFIFGGTTGDTPADTGVYPGNYHQIGTPMFRANLYHKLRIQTSTQNFLAGENPDTTPRYYEFPKCILKDTTDFSLGTKATKVKLKWKAYPYTAITQNEDNEETKETYLFTVTTDAIDEGV